MACCSFDKHELILIIFGKQHEHTFKKRSPCSLSLHFYLLYLLVETTACQSWCVVRDTVRLVAKGGRSGCSAKRSIFRGLFER